MSLRYQRFNTLSREQLWALKAACNKIIADGPMTEAFGICYNLDKQRELSKLKVNGYHMVSELAADWPHNTVPGGILREDYLGDIVYTASPVPSIDRFDTLWRGEQYKLRIDLLNHMIYRIEKRLVEITKNAKVQ